MFIAVSSRVMKSSALSPIVYTFISSKLDLLQDPDVMSLLGDDASDASQLTNITTCSESSNISFMPNKGKINTYKS